METTNIEKNEIISKDNRFAVLAREYSAVLLDVTNYFVELEHRYAKLTWGVQIEARNNGLSGNRWVSLHVFCEVSGEHNETYRQINVDSYDGESNGYMLCRKVEDFTNDFIDDYKEKLQLK